MVTISLLEGKNEKKNIHATKTTHKWSRICRSPGEATANNSATQGGSTPSPSPGAGIYIGIYWIRIYREYILEK